MLNKEIVSWSKNYSVNIPLIDAQHMELINLTNKLYRSCLRGRESSKDVFFRVLRGAVDYVGYHFSTEEKVMERVGYPDYAAHKKEHADFVKKVLKASAELSKDKKYNPMEFVRFLKEWVLSHIAVSDTAMGHYLVNLKRTGGLQHITLKVKQVSDRYVIQ